MTALTALTITDLSFAYPDGHQALNGVSLTVERGERVAIVGPNGAGKTTLVLHLNGIMTATSGSVSVGDLPVIKANLTEIRRRVGLVFQDRSRRPVVHADGAPGRRDRPTSACATASSMSGSPKRCAPSTCSTSSTERRITSLVDNVDVSPSRTICPTPSSCARAR